MSTEAFGPGAGEGPGRRMAEASRNIGVLNLVVVVVLFFDASSRDRGFSHLGFGLFLFSMVAVLVGFVLGLFAVLRAARSPQVHGAGKQLAAAGISASVLSALLLVPVLMQALRAHTEKNPHESVVVGDIRTVISAEAAYQSASGHFGTPECLMAPSRCVPDYPTNAPTFLDSALASEAPRSHYVRRFHPGPAASASPGAVSPPPGNLQSVAYTAVPADPKHTRMRSFCGDSTFRICFTVDGSAPPVKDGLCDPCNDLR